MNPKSPEARKREGNPFDGLIIENTEILDNVESRSACTICGKSRMYFCYTCFVPVSQLASRIPICALPIKIDIIKHRREIDGKSTAAHAAVLAPGQVRVFTYPEIPEYDIKNGRTVLLYPGAEAVPVSSLFSGRQPLNTYSQKLLSQLPPGYNVGTLMTKTLEEVENLEIYHVSQWPVDRVILIDSTWNQSRGIYADERLQKLPKIVLKKRPSQFWRHQKGSPRWYLSTIEALHQLLLELHLCAWGRSETYTSHLTLQYPIHRPHNNDSYCVPYAGQYDNLLFFFKFLYEKLHKLYDSENLLAYKRPMT
ncbi:DTW domain-containing protein 1 [Papilio xuthus]|uniref:tRNA-uridine aminocarboxypropyltransferase 1 n=1 Tax=Papilio xuthus TaxID=66420 RepID=A0A194PK70_PAPXU|nr:DTW domain-containing protein 1 [Papilio xuthus]